MWVPPEDKDPVVLHHPTRRSVGYFGAVRLRDGKLLCRREEDRFNGETFYAFLKDLRVRSSRARRRVVLIIDNAGYHHAKLHKDWREEHAAEFSLTSLLSKRSPKLWNCNLRSGQRPTTSYADYPQLLKASCIYDTFEPAEAKRIWDRLELHYTPKHGSWLNVAECEFSVLSRQCTKRRIPDPEALEAAVSAWQQERNHTAGPVKWRFTTEDARIRLTHLYPKLQG